MSCTVHCSHRDNLINAPSFWLDTFVRELKISFYLIADIKNNMETHQTHEKERENLASHQLLIGH
jgi:hypothetical protein